MEDYPDKIFALRVMDTSRRFLVQRLWSADPGSHEHCEYIRMDIYEEVKAELARAKERTHG